jgi:hypothetical protein
MKGSTAYHNGKKVQIGLEAVARMAGWPTPRTVTGGAESGQRKQELGRTESGGSDLQAVALLAGWNTPRATDGSNGGPNQAGGALPHDASLAGWATPTSCSPNSLRGTGQDPMKRKAGGHAVNLQDQVRLSGATQSLSPASTEKRGALNPAFSRWLMGYPPAWDGCAPTSSKNSKRK